MLLEFPAQAVAQARRLLGLPAAGDGHAWRVRRLAAPGAYFIVHIDGRVAALEVTNGALLASATASRAPVTMPAETALALAALGAPATAELVWRPCAASVSMFDPLWFVTHGHDSVFVDQRGQRWPTLPSAEPDA